MITITWRISGTFIIPFMLVKILDPPGRSASELRGRAGIFDVTRLAPCWRIEGGQFGGEMSQMARIMGLSVGCPDSKTRLVWAWTWTDKATLCKCWKYPIMHKRFNLEVLAKYCQRSRSFDATAAFLDPSQPYSCPRCLHAMSVWRVLDRYGHLPSCKRFAKLSELEKFRGPNLLHYKTIQEIELQRELEDLSDWSLVLPCWKGELAHYSTYIYIIYM